MPWYKNTLFVIIGDHIGPPQTMLPRMIDSYRVPIVFYSPGGRHAQGEPRSNRPACRHRSESPRLHRHCHRADVTVRPFDFRFRISTAWLWVKKAGIFGSPMRSTIWNTGQTGRASYSPRTNSIRCSINNADVQARLETKLKAQYPMVHQRFGGEPVIPLTPAKLRRVIFGHRCAPAGYGDEADRSRTLCGGSSLSGWQG